MTDRLADLPSYKELMDTTEQDRAKTILKMGDRIKKLEEFLAKLYAAEYTFQPDNDVAWQTVTVKEIIGTDRQLEKGYKALKEK